MRLRVLNIVAVAVAVLFAGFVAATWWMDNHSRVGFPEFDRPNPPLTMAVYRNDIAEVRRLIEAGEDVNGMVVADVVEGTWTAPGTPPLYAAMGGDESALEIVELLLDSGASTNFLDFGLAIDWAAGYGDVAAIEALVERGASPCGASDLAGEGESPIASAVEIGRIRKIETEAGC